MPVFVTGELTRQAGHQVAELRLGVRDNAGAALWAAAFFALFEITVIAPLVHHQ